MSTCFNPGMTYPYDGRRLAALLVWLLTIVAMKAASLPMTGTSIPELQGVDVVVSNFMTKCKVPGGAVGLVKDGRLVFVRGYGYADTNNQTLVYPDSLFRLASLSKSITAASVLKLVEEGRFSLDDKAFGLLNYPHPTYPGASYDSRLDAITIRQLLNHTGGWNRQTAQAPDGSTYFDPTIDWTVRAAQDMKAAAPAAPDVLVHWMLGKPLQFDPGTQYQYSNFGYTVLGRIVELASGIAYQKYAQSMLALAGITRMRIAGSRLADRVPGEVNDYDYPDASLVKSVFDQDRVPSTYALSYLARDAHGGWIASAIDLLRFIAAVDNRPVPPDILSKTSISNMIARPSPPWGVLEEPYYGMGWEVRNTPDNWWHTGALPGVGTEMVRAGNGFTWVLLFNFRAYRDDNNFFNDMDQVGWNAPASVRNWPTNDLFASTLSYDAWKAKHFSPSELADRKISGDDADPDNDGLGNLAEYALGHDPKSRDLEPATTTRVSSNGQDYLVLKFRRLLLEHEIEYRVESSDNMIQWQTESQIEDNRIANPDGTITVTYRDSSPIGAKPRHFLRLTVSRKPQ